MRSLLVGPMIMIVSWAIENNLLTLFRGILVRSMIVIVFLVISTGWLVIVIVPWAVWEIT